MEKSSIRHLVITGGEPLMQQDDLVELVTFLKPEFYVEVETNGTILPNNELTTLIDQWNVSPKTKNSGNPEKLCEDHDCYVFFSRQKNCYFKYVIEDENDLTEIKNLINKYDLDRNKVFLMPQAITKPEIISREKIVTKMAKDSKLSYSPRLHVSMWGNQRGK